MAFNDIIHNTGGCLLKLSMCLEVLHLLVGVGDDGVCAGLPASRTYLSVFISVLEGLDKTQGFIHTAANWQVVHGDLAQGPFLVNDEQTTQGVAVILEIHAIVL